MGNTAEQPSGPAQNSQRTTTGDSGTTGTDTEVFDRGDSGDTKVFEDDSGTDTVVFDRDAGGNPGNDTEVYESDNK
jgi:hypothetical protein